MEGRRILQMAGKVAVLEGGNVMYKELHYYTCWHPCILKVKQKWQKKVKGII